MSRSRTSLEPKPAIHRCATCLALLGAMIVAISVQAGETWTDISTPLIQNNVPLNCWYFDLAPIQDSSDNPFPQYGKEAGMARFQMDQSKVREVVLVRGDRKCPACGGKMHIRCCRKRTIYTFAGPVRLVVKLLQCLNEKCDTMKTFSPEEEAEYAMPRWGIGWDVFCWMGQRRFAGIGPSAKFATNSLTVTTFPCRMTRLRTILLLTRTWLPPGIRTWGK